MQETFNFMSDYRPSTDEERQSAVKTFQDFVDKLLDESKDDTGYKKQVDENGESILLRVGDKDSPAYIAIRYMKHLNMPDGDSVSYHVTISPKGSSPDKDGSKFYSYDQNSYDLVKTVKKSQHVISVGDEPKSKRTQRVESEAGIDEINGLIDYVHNQKT